MTSLPSLEALLAEARKRTGLSDFGDPWFREPLRILLDSMAREAQLNAMGARIQSERLITGLVNRLKIEDFLKRHPAIADEPVNVGAVIVGLGRSGSTMLQRLLAEAEGAAAIRWWETLSPVPFPDEKPGDPSARIALAVQVVDGIIAADPGILAIHPFDALAADEEVMLLEQSFVSSAPESYMHVPSYGAWLEKADQTPAYLELRRVLQMLTWQQPARRTKKWILKTPHHLTALDTVAKVFPEAKIVMPHRDPVKTVVSWCSLVQSLSKPNTDTLDPRRIGDHWSRRLARNLQRFMAVRADLGAARFVDVGYAALTRDPVGTALDVLRAIGLAPTAEDERRIRAWSGKNAREGRGAHVYAPADFGLNEARLETLFADYRRRFTA
ncbi:MAG: sulfotransferase [Rhodospirillaceae bacterium]|nr:sulfotransferase [Rhodospirillaceae bacterium]